MGTHCDFTLFLPDIVNSPNWVDCSDILRVWLQACVYTLPGSSHQNEGLFDPESFLRPAMQGKMRHYATNFERILHVNEGL